MSQDSSSSSLLRRTASRRRAIDRVLRAALPRLADFCLVHLATARTLRCVAAAHRARHFARHMRTMIAAHTIRRDDLASTVACVVRSCKPTLRTEIYHDNTDRASRGTLAEVHRKLAPTSALVVPLRHQGIVLGALSLCYSQSGRSHKPHHVPPAERLAGRIAAALTTASDAAPGLQPATRHAGQGSTIRRRVAARA